MDRSVVLICWLFECTHAHTLIITSVPPDLSGPLVSVPGESECLPWTIEIWLDSVLSIDIVINRHLRMWSNKWWRTLAARDVRLREREAIDHGGDQDMFVHCRSHNIDRVLELKMSRSTQLERYLRLDLPPARRDSKPKPVFFYFFFS